MHVNWQRARNPDQKAERVETILDAAAVLFDEKELSDISMRDLARARGTWESQPLSLLQD